MRPKYYTQLNQIDAYEEYLTREEYGKLQSVEKTFPFRSNEYYLSLIRWNDPEDPLRKIIIPDPNEMNTSGTLDPSSEQTYTVLPGLQHKYRETALLLVSDVCGGICRFCFRKRFFVTGEKETVADIPPCIDYIRTHTEITNVLLTGGDPLMLETRRLEDIVRQLCEIDHVKIIRIGSKLPAYDPYRITGDPALLDMIRKYSTEQKRIYIMTQFNHPRELTDEALNAVGKLQKAGAIIMNQTPLISGVNNSPVTLAKLFRTLSFIGVAPYYVFQCRPTLGNRLFTVPVELSHAIFQNAFARCSGLAKRARFIMSHTTGKIEVLGTTERHTFMKYHQAARKEDLGKMLIFRRNPEAHWFDDYSKHSLSDFIPKFTWMF